MHGILSSKRHHTFVRRPADAASRHADFSTTMDCEQQSPSVRLVYLYLLGLAQGSPMLDPRARPATAAERKWVQINKKRERSQDSSRDASDSDGNDHGGGSSSGHRVAHDHAHPEDARKDDADEGDSEATTGMVGPSAHTRSHDRTSQSQLALLSRKSTRDKAEGIFPTTMQHQHREWLEMLPLVERPLLDLNAIQIGKHCVVRLSKVLCEVFYSGRMHCTASICIPLDSHLCFVAIMPVFMAVHIYCTCMIVAEGATWEVET